MRISRTFTDRGPSVAQLSHQHLCAVLRAILAEAVQAGRRAAEGISTVPCQAVATLYLLLMSHPLDRRGRCRSCCLPGVVLRWRRRRCHIHREASVWLRQPPGFLRAQLAGELGLILAPRPHADPPTPSTPGDDQ
ncbi:MAG: hypothetical protein ACRDTC_10210 [Pseudonocardiaceae bacterium]